MDLKGAAQGAPCMVIGRSDTLTSVIAPTPHVLVGQGLSALLWDSSRLEIWALGPRRAARPCPDVFGKRSFLGTEGHPFTILTGDIEVRCRNDSVRVQTPALSCWYLQPFKLVLRLSLPPRPPTDYTSREVRLSNWRLRELLGQFGPWGSASWCRKCPCFC